MPKTIKCRVVARNLFMKSDSENSVRMRECEIGEELSYKEGKMPPAWTGKVETVGGDSNQKPSKDQSALIEKLTADLEEKDSVIEKLTADLEELTKPAAEKTLEQSNKPGK